MPSKSPVRTDTTVVHAGRQPRMYHGAVNPPVYRASTILFRTLEEFEAAKTHPRRDVTYGRYGTPTTFCLEEAVASLEGAYASALFPSGVAAIATTLLALLKPGDHVLVPQSVYGPARAICDRLLGRIGVSTTYYDPLIGSGIVHEMTEATRVVYVESPGSLTFEVQDLPAIADAAHARGALVVADNTWATPLYHRPLALGADISIHSATKYIVGHSDVMLGIVAATEATWQRLEETIRLLGQCAGGDDAYLAQRGLRTLSVRLDRHQHNARALADWLGTRPEVARVLHPSRPDHPGHALWKRDFHGASGLFGIVLRTTKRSAIKVFLESLTLFGMGGSWGGYESLVFPSAPEGTRTAAQWCKAGTYVRIHAGLEDPIDLIADLDQGLVAMKRYVRW